MSRPGRWHPEVETLLRGLLRRKAGIGHETSVGQFDDGRMNSSNKWAFASRADVIHSATIPSGFHPSPSVVAADRESRKVERDRDDAFLRADGIAGRLSTCAHHFGLRPGNAVVYRAAEQNVSMLPAFDNVEDCVVAVPPDFRRMIIHVLRIPERRGGLPFVRAEAQARGGVRGGEIGFSQGTRGQCSFSFSYGPPVSFTSAEAPRLVCAVEMGRNT